ncbi:unnamed protein product [Rotaria magnacalcarata]|nr:unnamed protein product [Rotaria magnacalcarata]
MEMGFDDRYFSSDGLYGHGAYFADNPLKSHQYTKKSEVDRTCKMFYCRVTLGQSFDIKVTDRSLVAAPKNYHSVCGLANPSMPEYIVYRNAQALPYILITYTA